MRTWFSVLAVFIAACAAGVNAGGDDDAASRPDSRVDIDANRTVPDANRSTPDAPRSVPDAARIPDAAPPPDGALICNTSADCSPGKCCTNLGSPPGICVTGTDINGFCLVGG